jgi:hypothetical protein
MAVCLVINFSGIDAKKYDAILDHMRKTGTSPEDAPGFISHAVGFMGDDCHVVDLWESQADFERFLEKRLRPAFDTLRITAEARVNAFEVHNTMRARG